MDKYLTGIKVPHWVRWIAVDKDGAEWGYSTKPALNLIASEWDTEGFLTQEDYLCRGKPPKNWKEELYHWS